MRHNSIPASSRLNSSSPPIPISAVAIASPACRYQSRSGAAPASLEDADDSVLVLGSTTTVTWSWSTDRNPPVTSISTLSAPSASMRIFPVRNTARIGWCPTRIPRSPSSAGAETDLASPSHQTRSAETTSTVSGTVSSLYSVLRGSPDSAQFRLDPVPVALQVLQATDVVEGLFRDVVVLAVGDLSEGFHRLAQGHRGPHYAGELLGHVGVLGQELLDPPSTVHGDLVLFGQFVDTQDCDDVLQFLVLLQDRLDPGGHPVVLLTQVTRVHDPAGGSQRVHRRVQAA